MVHTEDFGRHVVRWANEGPHESLVPRPEGPTSPGGRSSGRIREPVGSVNKVDSVSTNGGLGGAGTDFTVRSLLEGNPEGRDPDGGTGYCTRPL